MAARAKRSKAKWEFRSWEQDYCNMGRYHDFDSAMRLLRRLRWQFRTYRRLRRDSCTRGNNARLWNGEKVDPPKHNVRHFLFVSIKVCDCLRCDCSRWRFIPWTSPSPTPAYGVYIKIRHFYTCYSIPLMKQYELHFMCQYAIYPLQKWETKK